MVWIHRDHPVDGRTRGMVQRRYANFLKDEVFPTEDDMNEWISTLRRAADAWRTETFSFDVPDAVAESCLADESLEQYVKDMKPSRGGGVDGVRVKESELCVVCRGRGRYQIRCGHVFHRKCIEKCAKWKDECPVCQEPLITTVYI